MTAISGAREPDRDDGDADASGDTGRAPPW